jgi:hypothetical protein
MIKTSHTYAPAPIQTRSNKHAPHAHTYDIVADGQFPVRPRSQALGLDLTLPEACWRRNLQRSVHLLRPLPRLLPRPFPAGGGGSAGAPCGPCDPCGLYADADVTNDDACDSDDSSAWSGHDH